ncbi:MAG: flippase-like domain-containing protein [Deltaproteobacteria bacterium]|nr:flippase-like domain-containing protein [Deltaproteobacteria bacterium]
MKKNLLAGLLISAVLVYLALRGLQLNEIVREFKAVRGGYIPAAMIVIVLVQVARSIRWGVILQPLGKVRILSLLSVSFVGFLAIVSLPARLGELVRPWLIAANSSIGMTPALGTVLVERVLDSLMLAILFFSILLFMPLPAWFVQSSALLLIVAFALLMAMAFMIFRRKDFLEWVDRFCRWFPQRAAGRIGRLIRRLIEGFQVISDYRRLMTILLLSLVIWLMNAAVMYILMRSFGMTLPPAAAFIVMVVLMIGIAIPAAPGFIGNWHYFCILGLGLFGIPRSEALSFAVIHHILSVGIVVVLGVICLPFSRFSLKELKAELGESGGSRAEGTSLRR